MNFLIIKSPFSSWVAIVIAVFSLRTIIWLHETHFYVLYYLYENPRIANKIYSFGVFI